VELRSIVSFDFAQDEIPEASVRTRERWDEAAALELPDFDHEIAGTIEMK
jgi:hypothetical protein